MRLSDAHAEVHNGAMRDVPFQPPDMRLPELARGSVWLVGAGPGDAGLLTLLALHALAQADVLVYDALVDEAILTLARPDAERVFAGKRGGRPSASQADISRRLVALAKTGRRVARLKGGDPCLFGRGGEEALALARAGVPFRIVPGITAGIGGLAYAGIPATHRDTGAAVTFVTGHTAGGDMPGDLDWPSLARSSPTLVFYMALAHLGRIAEKLIAAGRPGGEPVAVISRATTSAQRVVVTTLASAAADARAAGLRPPALVAVGEVVRFRAEIAWFERLAEAAAGDRAP